MNETNIAALFTNCDKYKIGYTMKPPVACLTAIGIYNS